MSLELVILVLLIIGLAFMALEAFVPAFGLLGLGGVASFIAALIMMNNLESFYGMAVNTPILVGLGIIGVTVLGASFYFTRKALAQSISAGSEIMEGQHATITEWNDHKGRVHIDGESWAATCADQLEIGDTVIVEERQNLTLKVKKDS